MSITFEAVYEDGVLKPAAPLPLKEHDRVRVTVEPSESWADRTYGMCAWEGDLEELRRLAVEEIDQDEEP